MPHPPTAAAAAAAAATAFLPPASLRAARHSARHYAFRPHVHPSPPSQPPHLPTVAVARRLRPATLVRLFPVLPTLAHMRHHLGTPRDLVDRTAVGVAAALVLHAVMPSGPLFAHAVKAVALLWPLLRAILAAARHNLAARARLVTSSSSSSSSSPTSARTNERRRPRRDELSRPALLCGTLRLVAPDTACISDGRARVFAYVPPEPDLLRLLRDEQPATALVVGRTALHVMLIHQRRLLKPDPRINLNVLHALSTAAINSTE